jgi:hypothetical protein
MLRKFPKLFAAKLSSSEGAVFAILRVRQHEPQLKTTLPNLAGDVMA